MVQPKTKNKMLFKFRAILYLFAAVTSSKKYERYHASIPHRTLKILVQYGAFLPAKNLK